MFETIRRMLGRREARGIAMIRARLSGDRTKLGTLEAFYPNGDTASGPWPAATAMAAGDYLTDAAGFGATGALALAPRADARSASVGTPTRLRGGDVFRAVPDRSLRVPLPAVAELRRLLWPGQTVRLEVVEAIPFNRWSEASDKTGSPARRGWIAELRRSGDGPDDGGDFSRDDDDRVDGEPADDRSFTPQDAAAAAALGAAGYVVGSELEAELGSKSADGVDASYTPSGGSYDR